MAFRNLWAAFGQLGVMRDDSNRTKVITNLIENIHTLEALCDMWGHKQRSYFEKLHGNEKDKILQVFRNYPEVRLLLVSMMRGSKCQSLSVRPENAS